MLLKSILVFEIKLLGDPACCLLEARFFTCSSSYTSSLEMELGAFIRVGRHVDPLCFTSTLGIDINWWAFAFELVDPIFVQSVETQAVLVSTWEILGGSIVIVFVAWAVIYDRDGLYSLDFHTGNIRVSEFGTATIGVDKGPRELL
ncbi:hypothetical protein F2Q69_00052480 [Brassica cretica]|uniref:Uncharacterized protein n=1 Tax=Brassica cretica TaxID=69181 RepID=A0A8S9N0L1_BRACR|nr:hypothetical protein F2Q69_00052480 [Brassica cretica]